jgi:tRNA threonylcarbamoyl adenosine modification protein YeaZ
MSVLALDTSSRRRTVCILGTPAGELIRADVRDSVSVGEGAPKSLALLLGPDVTAVVVVVGPGSYTGLRAGMAAALGVAQARDLPLHGVGALEVVAAGAPEVVATGPPPDGASKMWAVVDAGRGGVYVASCTREDNGWRVGEARREPVSSLDLRGLPAVSADPVDIPRVIRVDPASALARAIPLALSRSPLMLAGLEAVYIA